MKSLFKREATVLTLILAAPLVMAAAGTIIILVLSVFEAAVR